MQHVTENAIINLHGYEVKTTNVFYDSKNDRVCFTATFTDNEINDSVRDTGYNNSSYAGNRTVYTWNDDIPVK